MAQESTAAEPPVNQVVASVAYINGRRSREVPIAEVGDYVGGDKGMLWIGLRNPTVECITQVVDALGASVKNREKMIETHRRPKIIDYGNMVLIVAITVEIDAGRPVFGETQYLVGEGFLVTVRRSALSTHSTLRERLESAPDLLKRGSDYITSELLDLLVDRYVAAAGQLESVVEHAEQKLLIRGAKDADIRKLYRQRRDLLRIHNAIAPMAEICRRLARVEMSAIDAQARPYFAEVADRVVRVDELINALREALAFAFEASLMIGQGQQNDTTRKLTSWAAILAVPTAVAGIYGMNFEYMPELKAHWGYPITLSVIVTICAVLYWRFRKSGWL
ncbi:magnesium and cobalt transport protein CorA [Bordetella holmesii]|uniref:CorA-like Mg2+ transporter family protein n=2 Tax=Bordetella holmesii TaxID=35814 RepID=A0ABP3BE90_9BORD|nr:magnesium and cobalt transport protein CorA [Bordetella holmesii]AHV94683.1 corA-like Mg2+ transporter family protein [Bordetella holmesii ATCC 51541]AIT27463.1 corA-like Mg2+ transporter family protein [Bordetella holmesii 44057]EWM41561.1 corA-like Mg2+ transporter family protein [Bordetella holmesii 41130]EWM48052.1 corA-like Mg2+ transporter family protein [Bordetella holmesii 35009]EWM49035.1 corA-like Mg2+ transporter family protein [Bordetella holmesii 70147]